MTALACILISLVLLYSLPGSKRSTTATIGHRRIRISSFFNATSYVDPTATRRIPPARIAVGWGLLELETQTQTASSRAAAGRAVTCVAKVTAVTRQRAVFTGTGAAVTANSGRVSSGHGVVPRRATASLSMRCHRRTAVRSMCAPATSTRTLSLTLLSRPRGFPPWVATGCNRYGTPVHGCAVQYRAASDHKPRPAAGDRAGPVQRRSALVHAPSSFRNKRHVPLGKKSPPSPNALIARPGGSNASAMDRPWPPGPSRTPRCAARNRNHAPSLPPGPRRPATPLRSGPVPPPPRKP